MHSGNEWSTMSEKGMLCCSKTKILELHFIWPTSLSVEKKCSQMCNVAVDKLNNEEHNLNIISMK